MLSSESVRSVLESAPDAMIIVDVSGSILFANQQVTTLFGHDRAAIIGTKVEELLPERFRTRHLIHRERFGIEARIRPMGAGLELFGLRRDGTEFPVEISLSPIRNDDTTLVIAAVRDVTDRKRIEAELIATREAANEARDAADRANQAKSRFLATASHDLRQPLQTLSLLNGTLRRMPATADMAEALAQQEQAIGAMSRLLNALLDISKLESGAVKPEAADFEVAVLLEELRTEFAGLAASKGLQFRVEGGADFVQSDRSLLEQILRNLVANAIKYTGRGWVRLRCLRADTTVRIEVADTGIGIPADEIPYIFDEFYQVGVSPNAVREGHGLGLSIVDRLARLLGHTLSVESEPGKGSVFSIELPAGAMRTEAAARAPRSGRAAVPTHAPLPHVLVVEDDPAVLSATRMLLKVEGYRVTTAASLAEAKARARENGDIRLLITDYHLGDGQTGSDVIASLRDILGSELGAILITGDTSSAVKELARDARLRVTSKPINADELLGLLKSLLAA